MFPAIKYAKILTKNSSKAQFTLDVVVTVNPFKGTGILCIPLNLISQFPNDSQIL